MRLLVVFLLAALAFADQKRVSEQGTHRMEVTLERLEDSGWKAIDPALVLDKDDRIRFKFKANFSGRKQPDRGQPGVHGSCYQGRVPCGRSVRLRRSGVVDFPRGARPPRGAPASLHAAGQHDAAV
jgi:hypothetical protein